MSFDFWIHARDLAYLGGSDDRGRELIDEFYSDKQEQIFQGLYFDARRSGYGSVCVVCPNKEDNTVHCLDTKDPEPVCVQTAEDGWSTLSFANHGRYPYPIGGGLGLLWAPPVAIQDGRKKDGGSLGSLFAMLGKAVTHSLRSGTKAVANVAKENTKDKALPLAKKLIASQPTPEPKTYSRDQKPETVDKGPLEGFCYPSGPGGQSWNVFKLLIDPRDPKSKSSFFIQVRMGADSDGGVKTKYLTVPDAPGPKGVIFTDDPRSRFTFNPNR